jgi:ABC-type antimicrobial peptide transport system ATPase subunit
MVPVDIISLACNTIQLIDTAIRVTKLCKEIYEHGSSKALETVQQNAIALSTAITNLEAAFKTLSTKNAHRAARLREIAKNAGMLADRLQGELDRLKLPTNSTRNKLASAVKITLKINIKRKQIERLDKSLKEQMQVLDAEIQREQLYVCPLVCYFILTLLEASGRKKTPSHGVSISRPFPTTRSLQSPKSSSNLLRSRL